MSYYERQEKRALGHGPRRTVEERLRATHDVPDHPFRRSLDGTCIYDGLSEKAHIPAQRSEDAPAPEPKPVREHTSAMIALFPDEATAHELALEDGEDPTELHVTLVFLGKAADLAGREEDLARIVSEFAQSKTGMSGEVSGLGLFTAGPQPVTYASVDLPDLPAFRHELVQALEANGFDLPSAHGYTPHMTLAYADRRDVTPKNLELAFNSIVLAIGGVRSEYPLTGPAPEQAAVTPDIEPHEYKHPVGQDAITQSPFLPKCDECMQEATATVHTDRLAYDTNGDGQVDVDELMQPVNQKQKSSVVVTEPLMDAVVVDESADETDVQRAFVTQRNGHTLITGPARSMVWEKALSRNPHMTWIQGRFVGGEKPNRNGAFWSTADLEFGQPTVQYGPLNWLHESRHIIGSIADAKLLTPGEQAADGVAEPHIVAAAGVWNWIYGDEAYVIEQASDAGKLWYSMECISETVQCMGENGCGAEVAYMDYMRGEGDSCQHMIERASTRRFVNPTFLGGAVIVPPVRPGWADADASIIREAAALAEYSWDLAKPDMAANEWEQMMTQVISYTA